MVKTDVTTSKIRRISIARFKLHLSSQFHFFYRSYMVNGLTIEVVSQLITHSTSASMWFLGSSGSCEGS